MTSAATPEIIIYTDGGARGNPGPAGAAFVVINNGKILNKSKSFLGKKTNNEAEYLAIVMAFDYLIDNYKNEAVRIKFYLDSELVARQLSGVYKVKSQNLKPLFATIKNSEKYLQGEIYYESISRTKNKLADLLVNEVIDENSS